MGLYISLLLLWHWQNHIPYPGTAATALAVVAGIMTLRGEMDGKEKLAWIVLLLGFLLLETTSIVKEHEAQQAEQDIIRAQQISSFRAIAKRIDRSIEQGENQFSATMSRSDTISKEIAGTVRNITGGDSFCWFTFIDRNFSIPTLAVLHNGQYPLRDVSARMVDLDKLSEIMRTKPITEENIAAADTNFQLGDLSSYKGGVLDPIYQVRGMDHYNFNVFFYGLNGFWTEYLRLRWVNGKYTQAAKVMRNKNMRDLSSREVVVLELVDPDYPRNNGKVDWAN